MTKSVDPDETTHYEQSHLDLHCLQKCLSLSTGQKRLICGRDNHKSFYLLKIL